MLLRHRATGRALAPLLVCRALAPINSNAAIAPSRRATRGAGGAGNFCCHPEKS